MKVTWIKTITISGELEVPDNLSEETQQQMARDNAANTDTTITELDWTSTDFYSDKPRYDGDVATMESDTEKYFEWFDID